VGKNFVWANFVCATPVSEIAHVLVVPVLDGSHGETQINIKCWSIAQTLFSQHLDSSGHSPS